MPKANKSALISVPALPFKTIDTTKDYYRQIEYLWKDLQKTPEYKALHEKPRSLAPVYALIVIVAVLAAFALSLHTACAQDAVVKSLYQRKMLSKCYPVF